MFLQVYPKYLGYNFGVVLLNGLANIWEIGLVFSVTLPTRIVSKEVKKFCKVKALIES